MTARAKLAPLAWAPMAILDGLGFVAVRGRWTAQVWDSGGRSTRGARPWYLLLSYDGYGVWCGGRCKSEASAKASAGKRLRKAGA